jgi:uncharacterized protein YecE (DUF72 family)
MKLHIGKTSTGPDLARYAARFDLLELRIDPPAPRGRTLRQWRRSVPEHFAFSLVVPRAVAALDPHALGSGEVEATLSAAEAVTARYFLLQTPASVRPSERTRQRLGELLGRLQPAGLRVAWEPRGIWSEPESERWAEELGVELVRDLSRVDAPSGDVVYTRLLALGDGARLRSSAVERVAERLAGRDEAFVVIEGEGALRGAQLLRELLGDAPSTEEALAP